MQYTNRADLLIAAGESIRMQEAALAVPIYKFNGMKCGVNLSYFFDISQDYEFPLAVVEGKPVFVGDELYCVDKSFSDGVYGKKTKVLSTWEQADWKCWSWNPPKPKTVMVELLREDAERFINYGVETPAWVPIMDSIRKALEKNHA